MTKVDHYNTVLHIAYVYDFAASELGFNSHKCDCGNSESLSRLIIERMYEK